MAKKSREASMCTTRGHGCSDAHGPDYTHAPCTYQRVPPGRCGHPFSDPSARTPASDCHSLSASPAPIFPTPPACATVRVHRSGGERQAGGRKGSGENPEGSGQGVNKKRKCETAGDGGSIAGAKSDTVTRMRPRLLAAAQSCTTQDARSAGAHER